MFLFTMSGPRSSLVSLCKSSSLNLFGGSLEPDLLTTASPKLRSKKDTATQKERKYSPAMYWRNISSQI